MKKEQSYDEEPVYYCTRCLSLNIKSMPVVKQDYCAECGSASVESTSIEEWKELYRKKYGHDYVQKRTIKWPYWLNN